MKKVAILLAFMGGATVVFLVGSSGVSPLSSPYYYYMPATDTNVLIKPPENVYTYSFMRTGVGTDTMTVWYIKNAVDSIPYKIPPNGGNERVVSFSIGPPISANNGIRVISGSGSALHISGGY